MSADKLQIFVSCAIKTLDNYGDYNNDKIIF